MRYWFLLVGLLFVFTTHARTIHTRIHEIEFGAENEPTLILLESGEVAKIQPDEKALALSLHQAKYNGSWLNVTVDKDRFITGLQTTQPLVKEIVEGPQELEKTFEPTILGSHEEANRIFKGLNNDYRRRSQCYNRAHVWSIESFKQHGLKSMKVFIFFTRKYIRDYDYGWWFHVSPYTYVSENGEAVESVLDYRFLRTPVNMKTWTDIFMYNDVTCPVVQKYSDYSQHQEAEYCYLYKTSMYYYQPLDLDKLETSGKEKHDWVTWEVNNAYKQGFGGWW